MKRGDFTQTFSAAKGPKGLTIQARPFFDRFVQSLPDGQELVLTVEPRKDKRSNAQNRMAWGTLYDQLIYGIADAAGYDRHERAEAKELIHEGLTAKFQGTVTDKVTGQQVRKFRTSKATKQEFTDYVEWVCRFAAQEYGVVVMLPGEDA
jgi:hypothetical protein